MSGDGILWDVRAFIYRRFVETAQAPTALETAAQFGLSLNQAVQIFADLHARHAIFLEPGAARVRMANPFSAIPTPFRVHAAGRSYWANCGWDAFGIPAALGADAEIEAQCAQTGQPLRFSVRAGAVTGAAALLHFPLPFARWYDDLIDT
jgi:hypothetical protein